MNLSEETLITSLGFLPMSKLHSPLCWQELQAGQLEVRYPNVCIQQRFDMVISFPWKSSFFNQGQDAGWTTARKVIPC